MKSTLSFEISKGSSVKYEIDPDSGIIYVDRKLSISMKYPGNYGFVPQTKTGDGDTVDVLMIDSEPLMPTCVVIARPIGVLLTEDQDGKDSKIIAVPAADEYYSEIHDITDISEIEREKIEHFFKHHKDLEKDKFVRLIGWHGRETALKIITDGAKAFSSKQ